MKEIVFDTDFQLSLEVSRRKAEKLKSSHNFSKVAGVVDLARPCQIKKHKVTELSERKFSKQVDLFVTHGSGYATAGLCEPALWGR
jgi:hypothetical protein